MFFCRNVYFIFSLGAFRFALYDRYKSNEVLDSLTEQKLLEGIIIDEPIEKRKA